MAKSRLPRKNTATVVPTIDPKAAGYDTIQQQTTTVTVPKDPGTTVPVVDWPKRKFADWALGDTSRFARIRTPRSFTAYIMALLARQAYANPDTNKDVMKSIFGDFTVERAENQTTLEQIYHVYTFPDSMVVCIPGLKDISLYKPTTSAVMDNLTGELNTRFFYIPIKDYMNADRINLTSGWGVTISKSSKPVIFCGHGRGGSAANWIAYKLNQTYPGTGEGLGAVQQVYTYGALAGWMDTNPDTRNFMQWHECFRFVAPNDPVPSTAQYWVSPSVAAQIAYGVFDYGANLSGLNAAHYPLHQDSYSYLIGVGSPVGTKESLPGYLYWKAKDTGEVTGQSDREQAHTPKNYCDQLREHCRDQQDTPVGAFYNANSWHKAMDEQGL